MIALSNLHIPHYRHVKCEANHAWAIEDSFARLETSSFQKVCFFIFVIFYINLILLFDWQNDDHPLQLLSSNSFWQFYFIFFILQNARFQPKHLRCSSRAAVSCEISSCFLMIKYQSEKLPVASLRNILVTPLQAHAQNYRLLFPSGF